MNLLIRGGHLIDPAAGIDGIYDVLVQDGVVKEVARRIYCTDANTIDATGKYVMPGFIDLHVHLREPGLEYKETIATGSMAAAAGGFTSICPMPNTKPATDSPEKIHALLEKAKTDSKVHILPIGAISIGQEGKELADIKGMAQAGAVAVSEDGKSVMNSALYAEGMKEAKEAGIPVFAHCEDIDLVRGGVMNAGKRAEELRLPGITNAVEDIITARDIFLAKETGVQLHLCHCSTEDSVKMIALAKEAGLRVSGETGPHYYTMTDEEIPVDFGNYKMNPPLRGKKDKEALIQALQNNVLEVIATDHAPHTLEEKSRGLEKSNMGVVGIETAFAVMYTKLVKTGVISLEKLVEVMHTNPVRRFGLKMDPAKNFTVFDLEKDYTVDPDEFLSMGRSTPFEGERLFGCCRLTVADGEIAWIDPEIANQM